MSVYNVAPFVNAAVDSILNQSFRDFEFIIINDGSTDGTVEQIAKVTDPRVRIIHQSNAGLARALNLGIEVARGQYIARQDGDDLSESWRLERQVEFLERLPDVGLVGCNATIIDEAGNSILTTNLPCENAILQAWLLDPDRPNPFIHGSTMFRRTTILQAGPYRPEFQQAQDLDLWLRIAEVAHLANLAEAAYRWRLCKNATGTTKWENQRDFGYLARQCAIMRRAGRPEPRLEIGEVHRGGIRRILSGLRSVHVDTEYQLNLAKMLIEYGQSRAARDRLIEVVGIQPSNAYAWFLLILSMMPVRVANRLWARVRRLYRSLIWRSTV